MHRDTDAGYQIGSVVRLWTNHNGKIFNIIHIHVNDTSDQVPIDVQYLETHDYAKRDIEFGKDAMGVPLRYKILVHDWKIRDVIYNNGETHEVIAFEEIPLPIDSFM